VIIYCTKCRQRREAQKATRLVTEKGRQVRRWVNRCLTCGCDHAAPPAGSAAARMGERSQRRAGQLPLFGGGGKR
jgi:hypothetical protein